MKPQFAESDTADTGGTPNGLEAWTDLQKATGQARANLIADIVGHPQGAPSVQELDYMNPALGEDALRRHPSVLADVGVIAELGFAPGDRVRGYPSKFSQLTNRPREL